MTVAGAVARAEFIYLSRSRLAVISLILFTACLLGATLVSSSYLSKETAHRLSHQGEADRILKSQPDRHPHRMVHYGHYVFRTPPPLATLDPGLDAYGGTMIFLEGHRQNAAMFAGATEGAALTRFGSFTPAFVLQVLAPLLLILIGYSSFTRERETGTLRAMLAQGASLLSLARGKLIVLLAAAGLCVLPVLIVSLMAALSGAESLTVSVLMVLIYGAYLSVWALGILCISLIFTRGSSAFLLLTALWLATTILIPKLAADLAEQAAPLKTAFQRDMEIATALRALGDSHNLNDPAYAGFKERILKQYNVTAIEDLPVNLKGVLAIEGERQGAELLARFNGEDFAARNLQAKLISYASVLSPMIAAQGASQNLAGTGLAAYHSFLQAAEDHRLAFVQQLNGLQATDVDYKLDTLKSVDVQSEKATRVSAEAWAKLPQFSFRGIAAKDRINAALSYVLGLTVWLVLLGGCFLMVTRRPKL